MTVLRITIDIDQDKAVVITNEPIKAKPDVKPAVAIPPPIHYTSFKCTACGGSYNKKTMKRHLETARHLKSLEVE